MRSMPREHLRNCRRRIPCLISPLLRLQGHGRRLARHLVVPNLTPRVPAAVSRPPMPQKLQVRSHAQWPLGALCEV